MHGITGNTTHINDWIRRGTYTCPGCQFRMAGGAFALSKAEYVCPRCGKYEVRDFRREHK